MIKGHKKERLGKVVSNKCNKTVVVLSERRIQHPVYGKLFNRSTRLMAHDENNEANVGDKVKIVEVRPLSKMKRWTLVKIIEKAK